MAHARRNNLRRKSNRNIFLQMEEDRQKSVSASLNFRRNRHHVESGQVRKTAVIFAEILAVVLAAFLLVQAFGIRIQMAGYSMEETIYNGDSLLLNRIAYKISGPKANDVVAFLPSDNRSAQYSVKRIIGVPGDSIRITNGYLYVNDEVFKDIKSRDSISNPGLASNEIVLGENQYFVLGDNRNNSEDSRYETIGTVEKTDIIGKVWLDVTFRHFTIIG